jgi:dihydroorotate dehydrogenase
MPFPVGISLGKSKITPLDAAVDDYLASLRILYRYGDYFAVNVSSPNTPGLRGLQDQTRLTELLGALQAEARVLAGVDLPKPLLVKLAPDLDEAGIAGVIEVCERHRIAGVIATNTTTGRYGLASADAVMANETGGLSGRPLNARACEVVRFIGTETGGRLPVVGVGGILDVADALRLFDAGASLVQLYTGLVYRGPDLVRRIGLAVAPTGHGHPRVNGSGRWGGSG